MGQRTPFIGPRPFTEADADVFFGRRQDVAALVAEVVSTQIILLFAPSGCGKSSLISAGLVPAMRDKGFGVARVRLTTLSSNGSQTPVDALTTAIRESASRSTPREPSLLILDQFEEIIGAVSAKELEALSETVYTTMEDKPLARIVLSFREEYLARIGELFNKVSDTSAGEFHLDRLSREGAREAFERPLEAVGWRAAPEAAELFVDKLAPPTRHVQSEVGYEPLYLQLLGLQLWSSIEWRAPERASDATVGHADSAAVVTAEDVGGLVDFDAAIARFFNDTIERVCDEHGVTEKSVRDWIDDQLITSDETRSMVRKEADSTKGVPNSVLDELVTDGLLRAEPRGEDVWLELAHDQLVERVREFNRIWWTERLNRMLLARGTRIDVAFEASSTELPRWTNARTTIWTLASDLQVSGLQLWGRYGGWPPFRRSRAAEKPDKLPVRAFVLSLALINSAVTLYRVATLRSVPARLKAVEGLDAEAAKRRLQATGLNLGRTDQALAVANVAATAGWVRLVSRGLGRSVVGGPAPSRRRWVFTGALLSMDGCLTLSRWAVRNGLIASCLDPGVESARSRPLGREDAGVVRRCRRLEDAASWSKESPVLLVLDWRDKMDAERAFARFRDVEIPLYESALGVRGAMVGWCCRSDVRRQGWRSAVRGVGFPARGQRTYYMVERGSVVAWRTVKRTEFPVHLQSRGNQAAPNSGAAQRLQQRFKSVLVSLIVSSESAPTPWREYGEQYFKASLGFRGGK